MYDRKNEANEFVADDREEAIAAAVRFYDTDADELRISELPAGEIYGLGGRSAIVAVPKNAKPPTPSRDGGDGDRGGRGGRDRGDRGGRSDRGGRGGGRGGDRGGRGGGDRGGRSERGPRGASESRSEASADAGPLGKATRSGDLSQVGEFVAGAMERMRIGDFEVAETREDNMIVVQLNGDAVKTLRSKDARAVDGLQMIASQAAKQADEDAPRVVIEVDGEVDGGGDGDGDGEFNERDDSLKELAERALKRARDTTRAIALDPMSSRDRRIIHLVVKDEDGVATMSIGSGRFRQVLVVPEGAPEYEEATEASDGGAS